LGNSDTPDYRLGANKADELPAERGAEKNIKGLITTQSDDWVLALPFKFESQW
jgi:hypothetical protein